MINVAINLIGVAIYAITGLWRALCRKLEAAYLRATISGLEDDLRILRGMPGPNEMAKELVAEELEIARQRLHLITRKGGV